MTEVVSTRQQLHDFVDDLEKCLRYMYPEPIDCDNIILCGMGGSAISGNIVADYCYERSKKPIVLVMNADVPNWVNERTLAVISSYSGNTLETLESYKQSLSIGCKRIVITSGGILKQLAEKNGDSLILLPNNLHPRHSIGYMIGYIFGVIRTATGIDYTGDILDGIDSLRKYRDELEDNNGFAMKLASRLIRNIPVICSYNDIQSIVFRWKTQLNENSKYVAFCATMSEFVYSDLRGWINSRKPNYSLIIIVNNKEETENNLYVSKLIGYLEDHGVDYRLVTLGGKNHSENMFRALMLGDYISMYMAEIQKINPSDVPPITLLKTKLKPIIDESVKDII